MELCPFCNGELKPDYFHWSYVKYRCDCKYKLYVTLGIKHSYFKYEFRVGKYRVESSNSYEETIIESVSGTKLFQKIQKIKFRIPLEYFSDVTEDNLEEKVRLIQCFE